MSKWLGRQLDRLLDWAEHYELLALLSFVIAVAGMFVSFQQGLTGLAVALLLLLGAAVGALVVAFFRRKNHTLRCVSCEKVYQLSGPRGSRSTHIEVTRFLARSRVETFAYSIRHLDGTVQGDCIEFRDLGKGGKANPEPKFRALDNHSINEAPGGPEGITTRITPPAAIKRKHQFEVRRRVDSTDSFPAEHEGIGKRVLFPISRLHFRIEFEACEIANVSGTKYLDGQPVDGGFQPLEPGRTNSGACVVEWVVEKAEPGEKYVIGWRWA